MKLKNIITKILFSGFCALTLHFILGNNVYAALPEPVVEYTFESTNGKNATNTGSNKSIKEAQIIGSGEFISDFDRGMVFYNHDESEYAVTVRENYLKLPTNTLSLGINKGEFSISFWVKIDTTKVALGEWQASEWVDLFVAYDSSNWEKYPMTKLGVNLIGRVNNITSDSAAYFDTVSRYGCFNDNNWHLVAFTISSSYTGVYLDGNLVHSITLNGNPGAYIGDFLTNSKNNLDMVCIGGNSLWNMDPDICALFDDVCIYNSSLTAAQIKELYNQSKVESKNIEGGVKISGYIKEGVNIPYSLDTTKVSKDKIKSYQWYIGNELVATTENYAPTSKYAENLITLKISFTDGSYTTCNGYFSILPVLYIESDTAYSAVTKDNYVNTVFTLFGDGYKESELYNGDAKIKLRGNSTSGLAKKPFKVKLDSKTSIFGMGKSKHWVLLANGIDVSLMRNKLLQGLAGNLGLNYMDSELVTLVYNGEYMGVYELSEHVRIGSTRVDIYDWEELAEDAAKAISKELLSKKIITAAQEDDVKDALNDELTANYSWITSNTHKITSSYLKNLGKTNTFSLGDYIDFNEVPSVTGGVLLEMDFWVGDSANLLTAYNQPIYMNTPSSEASFPTLEKYMKEYIQAMEYSLHSTDFIYHNDETHYKVSSKGWYDFGTSTRVGVTYETNSFNSTQYDNWHYTDFLDMDSAVNNMLICEFSLNWDCMKNSFFMYKDIDGKIVFGPTWDFDWAWGNSMGQDTNAPETWQTTNEWFANEQYYQTVQFNRMLIRDPYFIVKLYERYHEVRDEYIAPIVESDIKTMYNFNLKAGLANTEKWGGAFSATAGQTYAEQYNKIKTFLTKRLAWLDTQFADIDTLAASLGYYKTSDKIKTSKCDTSSQEGYTIIAVTVSDATIKKVSFQVNGTNIYTADVKSGTATVKVPDSALTNENGKLNVVQYRAMDGNGNYIVNSDGTDVGNYTNAVSNYNVFKKTITTNNNSEQVTTSNSTTDNGTTDSAEDVTTEIKTTENSSENITNNNENDDVTAKTTDEETTTKKNNDSSKRNLLWIIPVVIAVIFLGGGIPAVIIVIKHKKKLM